jgi:4-alpha-glucanotransferase
LKFFPRESGVLLHITSLPGPYGLGDIGPEAFNFVDVLHKMGQSLWQILPLGDTGSSICPYITISAFANNPLLISLDGLIDEGYLHKDDLKKIQSYPSDRVDYQKVYDDRYKILDTACTNFIKSSSAETQQRFDAFCKENEYWLSEYILFQTLKKLNNDQHWITWQPRHDPAGEDIIKENSIFIQKLMIQQFLFIEQWQKLKTYANEKGIRFVGDIPIYVSHDSVDVWANTELFKLDDHGKMKSQSGCPPDFFNAKGQVWGHPIYNWAAHEKSNYQWWIDRLRYLFNLVDIVRIDHFNGFAKYWEIPVEQNNVSIGKWVKGPGEKLLLTVQKSIGSKPIIAEDLGEATKDAKIIRDRFAIPGMKILQMSFGKEEQSNSLIPELNQKNIVVYTGTHDNDTSIGWLHTKPGKGNTQTAAEITLERKHALKFLGTDGSEINWDFISLAMNSKANTVVIPLQDIMGLGTNARMNIPGTVENNWEWRFKKNKLTSNIIERMRTLTEESKRMKG